MIHLKHRELVFVWASCETGQTRRGQAARRPELGSTPRPPTRAGDELCRGPGRRGGGVMAPGVLSWAAIWGQERQAPRPFYVAGLPPEHCACGPWMESAPYERDHSVIRVDRVDRVDQQHYYSGLRMRQQDTGMRVRHVPVGRRGAVADVPETLISCMCSVRRAEHTRRIQDAYYYHTDGPCRHGRLQI